MSVRLDQQLAAALEDRKVKSRYRTRQVVESPQGIYVQANGKRYLNFCSNDYLGLANHPELKKAFSQAVDHYGVGSGASHLVNGHSTEHHALEEELADFTGRERALLFSSGYMANLGAITALVTKGDCVFEDKLNHASLLDAALLSRGDLKRFKHNNIEHLQQVLQSSEAKSKLLAVDGVFSMDGDLAPLPKLSEIARRHNTHLMVDDAHAFGCVGKRGAGTCEYFALTQADVPVLMGTLGKALGSFGAFIAGSENLIESLIQFSRSYIYTTALPPAVAAASRKSLYLIQQESWRREKLSSLVQQFRKDCRELGIPLMDSITAIQPIVLGSDEEAMKMAASLEKQGIWVSAIRPPTVPEGSARLRITFSAEHEEVHVRQLLSALEKGMNR